MENICNEFPRAWHTPALSVWSDKSPAAAQMSAESWSQIFWMNDKQLPGFKQRGKDFALQNQAAEQKLVSNSK